VGDEAVRQANRPDVPGTTLLKIAQLLFSERLLSEVVRPTISDLQHEVAAARSGRVSRLRAQCRGYLAFWKLAVVAPFASGMSQGPRGVAFHGTLAGLAGVSIVLSLAIAAGVGAWVSALCAATTLFAIAIHGWYQHHPSELPIPAERPQKASPQINFSSMDVAGNIGGLIFAVGSVLIVAVGLPSVIWFLFVATIAGCGVAWVLVTWRTRHPHTGRQGGGIELR
jgi:hypothetical protein